VARLAAIMVEKSFLRGLEFSLQVLELGELLVADVLLAPIVNTLAYDAVVQCVRVRGTSVIQFLRLWLKRLLDVNPAFSVLNRIKLDSLVSD